MIDHNKLSEATKLAEIYHTLTGNHIEVAVSWQHNIMKEPIVDYRLTACAIHSVLFSNLDELVSKIQELIND